MVCDCFIHLTLRQVVVLYKYCTYMYNKPIPKIPHVKHSRTCVKWDTNNNKKRFIFFPNVDCEAIRGRITLKRGQFHMEDWTHNIPLNGLGRGVKDLTVEHFNWKFPSSKCKFDSKCWQNPLVFKLSYLQFPWNFDQFKMAVNGVPCLVIILN